MTSPKTIIITALPGSRGTGGNAFAIRRAIPRQQQQTTTATIGQQAPQSTLRMISKSPNRPNQMFFGHQASVSVDRGQMSILDRKRPLSWENPGPAPPRKRERLVHLTPEEKMYRRKMKNRVAAQTARDRKKVKMGTLEETVETLIRENETLMRENARLRQRGKQLSEENLRYKEQIEQQQQAAASEEKSPVEVKVEPSTEPIVALGSAVSISGPQPREQATVVPPKFETSLMTLIWTLLSSICRQSSAICSETPTSMKQLETVLNSCKENNLLSNASQISMQDLEAMMEFWKAMRKKGQFEVELN